MLWMINRYKNPFLHSNALGVFSYSKEDDKRMNHIFVKDGQVKKLSKREAGRLKAKAASVIEGMTPDELERYNQERREKFIGPLMEHNRKALKKCLFVVCNLGG